MEKYVEIESLGQTLRGMMHIPPALKGKIPFVILFHGFQDDRNEINFVHTELSRKLCKLGIGSVRFDFIGSGESDGVFSDITVSKEVQNGIDILEFVRTLDFVDLERIAIHGLSLGGCVASMVAGRQREKVRALSLWCPAHDLVYNLRNKKLCGQDIKEYEEGIDVEGLCLSWDFYKDCQEIDPFQEASRFDKHVNLVHGDSDTTASVNVSQKLKEIYQDRAKLLIVNGADHRFTSFAYRQARMDSAIQFLREELKYE